MSLNPLAIATQGLGFTAAIVALQGLLQFVFEEVKKYELQSGGGLKTRRRISTIPLWLPELPAPDDEDALLLIGII